MSPAPTYTIAQPNAPPPFGFAAELHVLKAGKNHLEYRSPWPDARATSRVVCRGHARKALAMCEHGFPLRQWHVILMYPPDLLPKWQAIEVEARTMIEGWIQEAAP